MTKITAATRQYWLDTVLGWAEDRLMPPQFVECQAALTAPDPAHLDAFERDTFRTLAAYAEQNGAPRLYDFILRHADEIGALTGQPAG